MNDVVVEKQKKGAVKNAAFRAMQVQDDVFTCKDIYDLVVSEIPNAVLNSIRTIVSRDFARLGICERRSTNKVGGVKYQMTEKGKKIDPENLPSAWTLISESKNLIHKGRKKKDKDPKSPKLPTGEIDSLQVGEAIIILLNDRREKIIRLTDHLENVRSESKRDVEILQIKIKDLNNDLRERDRVIESLRKVKEIRKSTFSLEELAGLGSQ